MAEKLTDITKPNNTVENGIPLARALEILGHKPDGDELDRLVEYYPTYELAHRKGFPSGYFEGKSIEELVAAKLQEKNIRAPVSPQSLGGHTKWAKAKSRRLIIRLLYLRYRLDDGLTKRQANQKLFQENWSTTSTSTKGDQGQSNVRKATLCDKLK